MPPPPVCRFPQICHCRFTEICRQKPPPQFADFLKSAIADLLKIFRQKSPLCRFFQICHCRFTEICRQKSPPPVCRFPQICHCRFTENLQAENPPFADFFKSATADLLKSAGRNSPPICRFTEILQICLPPGTFIRKTFYPRG